MPKLTAQDIDSRVQRMIGHFDRLLDAGEITLAECEAGLRDLAQWSAAQYAKLPQAQAVEAILKTLLK